MSSFFLKLSAKLGNSIVDWIRSIYFSLFGSSALAFGLKVTALETRTSVFYALANVCFLLGLFFSVKITNRFKKLENRFGQIKPSNVEDIKAYYVIQDNEYSFQHLLLYLLFIPAFAFIVIAGSGIENKAKEGSAKVFSNESRLDSSLVEIAKQNQYLMLKIDSLEMKLDSAIRKPKPKPQTNSGKANIPD